MGYRWEEKESNLATIFQVFPFGVLDMCLGLKKIFISLVGECLWSYIMLD